MHTHAQAGTCGVAAPYAVHNSVTKPAYAMISDQQQELTCSLTRSSLSGFSHSVEERPWSNQRSVLNRTCSSEKTKLDISSQHASAASPEAQKFCW